jgi:hypothetical protein
LGKETKGGLALLFVLVAGLVLAVACRLVGGGRGETSLLAEASSAGVTRCPPGSRAAFEKTSNGTTSSGPSNPAAPTKPYVLAAKNGAAQKVPKTAHEAAPLEEDGWTTESAGRLWRHSPPGLKMGMPSYMPQTGFPFLRTTLYPPRATENQSGSAEADKGFFAEGYGQSGYTRLQHVGHETYVSQPGDTLADIARHELGDATRWRELYELNRERIGADPNCLPPGLKLVLPNGSPADATTRQPPPPGEPHHSR